MKFEERKKAAIKRFRTGEEGKVVFLYLTAADKKRVRHIDEVLERAISKIEKMNEEEFTNYFNELRRPVELVDGRFI